MRNVEDFLEEKISQENGPAGREKRKKRKKDMTERVTRLSRGAREEIVKWNQMAALRF